MARIARTVDYLPDIETEVAVARWLELVAFPAVRLAGPADQPFVADGRVVTFWELVSGRTEYGTAAELAALLRWLHERSRLHLLSCQGCGRSRGSMRACGAGARGCECRQRHPAG